MYNDETTEESKENAIIKEITKKIWGMKMRNIQIDQWLKFH
jgi:hypothetical protein